VEGDGRFLLERELRQGSQGFDVLLVDAFSGGNIPWHLITLEAFDIYLKHLKPDGLLVINVTNRLPVDRLVLANARVMNLHAALVECPSPENPATLRLSDRHSKYVILGRRGEILSDPGILRAAKAILFPGNSIHKNSVLGPAALECRQRYAEELLGNIHPWTDASNSLSRLVFSR
jgi:hypothetical protein